MKKYFSILLMFAFLVSCGYTPIYSNKNLDFKLKDVINYENSRLNSKITKKLQSFSNLQSHLACQGRAMMISEKAGA